MKNIQNQNTAALMPKVTCVVPSHVAAARTRGVDFRATGLSVVPATGVFAGRATGFRTPRSIT